MATTAPHDPEHQRPKRGWRDFFSRRPGREKEWYDDADGPPRWSMGVLNDKLTVEVPGSVVMMANDQDQNEPLGLRITPQRTVPSSLPVGMPRQEPLPRPREESAVKKRTADGKIILDPQPDDSMNDPLNWSAWRRDAALLSLGLFCMVGGGMTPLLAAGFTDVSEEFHVPVSQVSLTTGLYMMGMGLGSVIFSPTAILFGKRPVYLFGALLFILTSVWCALSPNFISLIMARIFQGIAVSPVECLPSATIAEIFFLHERAFRIGTYTLLLLGGKNLIPLISAAIIQWRGWRWVFWLVAAVVGFCGVLLFLFVPETFWDRSPTPKKKHRKSTRSQFFYRYVRPSSQQPIPVIHAEPGDAASDPRDSVSLAARSNIHVGFAPGFEPNNLNPGSDTWPARPDPVAGGSDMAQSSTTFTAYSTDKLDENQSKEAGLAPSTENVAGKPSQMAAGPASPSTYAAQKSQFRDGDHGRQSEECSRYRPYGRPSYTNFLRDLPPKSFVQQLKPYHGRLNQDSWFRVAVRPLILFSYPAVLWSALIYACSVGWLIVISESVAVLFRSGTSYNFDALRTGLIYLSPFIGSVLGSAVAGKLSDVVVKAMARRNGGLYEPEFRLVMALPIALTTGIGLMGFGWSAQQQDNWMVPTVFFGIVSFGCSLGSTTSITFCVDSYRQYAGEALVTLNFSKNIFHGLVFSLFVTNWIDTAGARMVFIWIGVIQMVTLLTTIPMYIFGKRARMWTVRKNFMEKF